MLNDFHFYEKSKKPAERRHRVAQICVEAAVLALPHAMGRKQAIIWLLDQAGQSDLIQQVLGDNRQMQSNRTAKISRLPQFAGEV